MRNDHLDHENRPRKNSITPDDLKVIRQRRVEEAQERKAYDAVNLHRAAALGQALKRLKDEG